SASLLARLAARGPAGLWSPRQCRVDPGVSARPHPLAQRLLLRAPLSVRHRRVPRGRAASSQGGHTGARGGLYTVAARRRGHRCEGPTPRSGEARLTALIELDRVSRTFHTPGGTITAFHEVSLAFESAAAIDLV